MKRCGVRRRQWHSCLAWVYHSEKRQVDDFTTINKVNLHSLNPDYEDIELTEEHNPKITGILVDVIKKERLMQIRRLQPMNFKTKIIRQSQLSEVERTNRQSQLSNLRPLIIKSTSFIH